MSRWPKAVLQFEDFQLPYAHPLLQRYKDQHLVFNDDIQVCQAHIVLHTAMASSKLSVAMTAVYRSVTHPWLHGKHYP